MVSEILVPASIYECVDDLAIVTTFFNPCDYRTKLSNYTRFRSVIETSGIYLLTIEVAFGTQAFVLTGTQDSPVIQKRARDIMWQKERLLNIAVSALPNKKTKVVWADCDLLFANPQWAKMTSELLDRFAIIQPFGDVIRLPRCCDSYFGDGQRYRSFAAVIRDNPNAFNGPFHVHGHTGFAWGASREMLLRTGIYDACLAGGGDHMIAHAACGDWVSNCVRAHVGPQQMKHFREWSTRFFQEVGGNVGFVPGTLLHLWHGEAEHRLYYERHRELQALGFEPSRDLRRAESGVWEWASDKPGLHEWARGYFQLRNEDGRLQL